VAHEKEVETPIAQASALEAGLSRANARVDDVIQRILKGGRVDVRGLPASSVALVLTRLRAKDSRPTLLVASDNDAARRLATDLRFFVGGSADEDANRGVLLYPGSDTSPFVEVAPDRRTAMDRLGTLFHLAQGLPFDFLVVAAPALLRKVPPKDLIRERSRVVRVEEELERDDFIHLLQDAGYLRVPVVEDAGTFAVRGSLIDVYPPHARMPARIELDDYLVMSIKHFDPEDQRTVRETKEIFVHPVRDTLFGPAEIELARERVRHLCDAVDWPSTRTRQLIDDIECGRAFFGIDGFLPAFYPTLNTLFDFLPANTRSLVIDPTSLVRAINEELTHAEADHEARRSAKAPTFKLTDLYLDEGDCAAALMRDSLVVVHRLAVGGSLADDETSALASLDTVAAEAVMALGGEDQTALSAELKLARSRSGRDEALLPLAARVRSWLDDGLRVIITTRTATQGERILSILRGYDVPADKNASTFEPSMLRNAPDGKTKVVVGSLGGGFVLASEALACVTEEEIFGSRAAERTSSSKKKRRGSTEPFLEDLRQLAVGDYVVHVEHGIGKYLGLERKTMPRTKFEEMRGVPAVTVEVLVVEYTGGDKLFLPVTRLNQIQKFKGGEGNAPKLDRLGGQTFAKTKARVARAVQELADELLRLYAARQASERKPIADADRSYAEFEATFPFDETQDQARAIEEVLTDLETGRPMDRVVCGDVGFGKTEVAMRAAFRVAMAGRQVALLCPTTVLAQQHFNTFRDRMRDYPLRVEVLSRFVDKKDQTEIIQAVKEGKVDVLIGTHRLLSKDIHFKQLGLLVVDEEQRFGVTHKERVKKLKTDVDVLTLSATPIPRTLQLAVGGLRDLSLITTPPSDRRAIRTFVTRWDDHLLTEAIQREVGRGGQIFFVYNRIEGLYERAARIQAMVPTLRIAVAHGQMGEEALEKVMTDFVDGRYDMLCATAIIESGLDIPRANTILIDRADTFGLAQLYQLRGRVGRSRERAYCYLITPPPSQMTDDARARIEALERFSELGSGFQVASLDMELRGAGDLLGAEQSGSLAAVGFDMFVHMLEDAVAHLRGTPITHELDPELTLDMEQFIPEQYIDDVGIRLSLYKRFASAHDEDDIQDLAREMEDRFGPPPPPALQFIRAMSLKPRLRPFRALGCEASRERVTLHLRQDTPLDPAKVMKLVAQKGSVWKLSPDMKLTRRFTEGDGTDSIEHVLTTLKSLESCFKD
jgi:transcription-repair coupling factor (superfamily II helicase)